MQGFHHLLHHGRLVHLRGAHVHVENLRSGLGLRHGLLQHVVHVALPQRLLEPLFAGGIDALAHHGHAVYGDALHGRTDHRGHGVGRPSRHAVPEHIVQKPDEIRCGAAAAARRKQSQLPVRLHLPGVQLRRDIVAAAVGAGQTGVGLHEHREVAGQRLSQPLRHGEDLLRAKRAVDAQRVRAQSPCRGGKALHRAAGEGAAPCLKAHAGQHRKLAVFLHRQQGGL